MNSHVFLGQLEVDFDVPNEVLGYFPVGGLLFSYPTCGLSRNLSWGVQQILVLSSYKTKLVCLRL